MKRALKGYIYILFCILSLIPLTAREYPRLEPAAWAAEIGSRGERVSLEELSRAALLASGTEEEQIAPNLERIDRLIEKLPPYLAGETGLPEGEAILHYLHDELFTVYREPQTRLDVTLQNGSYNCVSSAVLYMLLAKSRGIEVEGVVTPDHAFCRIIQGTGGVDVETTNRYGYNPGEKREFKNAFGETGFSYVPPGNYRLRTSIDERELIGLILQNRISLLQRQGRIDLTVPLAVDRYTLSRSERTREELRKELINYASVMNGRQEYLEALDYLDRVRRIWGDHADYLEIIDTLLYNAAVTMSQAGREDQILGILSARLEAGDISPESAKRYRQLIGERMIYRASRSRTPEESLAYLEELAAADLLSPRVREEYLAILHGMKAQNLAREAGDLSALAYLRSLGSELRRDGRIRRAEEVYAYNAAAGYHNRFVELFRAERYLEAEALILEGLEELPRTDLLRNDLNLVRRALERE